MARSYKEITYTLSELQNQELSIIRLSESISAANTPDAPKRTSDVSSDAFEDPSPASLAADLDHYKVCLLLDPLYLDVVLDKLQRNSSPSSDFPISSK